MSKVKLKMRGVQQLNEGTVNFNDQTVKINGSEYKVDELPVDVPLSGTIYGTLLNYQGVYEALESSMNKDPYKKPPKAPILYIKPTNTQISAEAAIPMPNHVSELEMGAALGIVISKQASKVKEEEALDYVFGYTIVNDVSIPHDSVYRPAIKEKARDGFCPVGPWIMERDAIENPDELAISVSINGELKQENNTKNLIRSVRKLLADVTSFMTLYAGDTLMVGVPEHAPLAKENDHVQIEIAGIGTLKNTIHKEEDVLGGIVR
ncbi:fumarylacetoacetate hydrolase family protein [Lentibacillus sp. Marseille-P4043]|uniref:fumarylacetoacetate hydrolase family protein n=1 Tax=Lentibacillus sp. Marseille-P4043 TaxID=2040293 RepID=UPI000D0B7574|nr:fumarylacetoacetate hydrolase family protein [Lentibacillus sp. Marseille-P4043]